MHGCHVASQKVATWSQVGGRMVVQNIFGDYGVRTGDILHTTHAPDRRTTVVVINPEGVHRYLNVHFFY